MEPRCPNCSTTQQPVWRVCVGEEPILDAIEAVSEAYKSATIASQETLEQSTVGSSTNKAYPVVRPVFPLVAHLWLEVPTRCWQI